MRSKSLIALMALLFCSFGLLAHADEPGDESQVIRRHNPRINQNLDAGQIENEYTDEYEDYREEDFVEESCHSRRHCRPPEILPYPQCRVVITSEFIPNWGYSRLWTVVLPGYPPLAKIRVGYDQELINAIFHLRSTGQCLGHIRNLPFPMPF